MSEKKLAKDVLTCCTEEADELVNLLLHVMNGDVVITNVTKIAGKILWK